MKNLKLLLTTIVFINLFLIACTSDSGSSDNNSVNNTNNINNSNNTNNVNNVNNTNNVNNSNNTSKTPIAGVYLLSGNDESGSYSGEVEIIDNGDSTFSFIQTQVWENLTFEQYDTALAFEGSATSSGEDSIFATVVLKTRNFITSYDTLSRNVSDPAEITCNAEFLRVSNDTFDATFVCEGEAYGNFHDSITWNRANGITPIWENQRELIASNDPLSTSEKTSLWQTYSSFHDLPEVQPYVNRTEFNEGVHYFIYDPTDLDFYSTHPDIVRAIQSVPDEISFREARQRRDAYSSDLHEKESIYESEVQTYFLDTLGMFSDYNPADPQHPYVPSGDGMLWTGVYVAAMSMKYMLTNDQSALDNLLRSLNGQITCWEIMPNPGDFARTIRVHKEILPGENWVQGSGSYAGIDYLPGANNDMLKGYFTSFVWAYKALSQAGGHQSTIDQMITIADDLVHNFPPANDGRVNEMYLYMMLYMMDDNTINRISYQSNYESLWQIVGQYINAGEGPEYNNGVSDWSGNHLHTQAMLGLYVLTDAIGETSKWTDVKDGMMRSLESMRYTRLGLFQLVMGTLGHFSTPPPEINEALQVLQEFPASKSEFNVDWRINPDFCMSPFPRLPWKNDWTTSDRTQSLYAYPLFEITIDGFHFKSCPFNYKGGDSGRKIGGIDYLFAYWFGRYFSTIPAT